MVAGLKKKTTQKTPAASSRGAEVVIRPAKIEDVPALITMSEELFRLHRAFHDEYYALSKMARDYWMGRRQRYISARNTIVFVAERGGRIVGYAVGAIEKRPPSFLMEQIGRIGPIFVGSRYRGRGIAKRLLHAALDWFYGKSVSLIEANMDVRNAPGVRLFERAGFRAHQTKFLKGL